MSDKPFSIKAVIFDFDGTLTKPGTLNFPSFKKSLGCPVDQPTLEYIESLTDPDQRNDAFDQLHHFEMAGAENAEPNEGVDEVISYIRSQNLLMGIVTRNSRPALERAFANFKTLKATDFELVLTRDEPVKLKPDPESIEHAGQCFSVNPSEILVVGDFIFDIQAGNNAGAVTVFLDQKEREILDKIESNFTITSLPELIDIVRMGIPLPAGKFPNDLLDRFFNDFTFDDPSILIHPGVGEDTAAVDISGEEVMVLKSDPITFATDAIGQYAVLINANDIATAGAVPRWFLTTLMFPCNTTPSEIRHTMEEIRSVCGKWNITLCGGHTEITDAVTRPVITGMLVGTVAKERLIDKRNMKQGDQVLLTKAVAVEGTAIIAREFAEKLKGLGISDTDINTCQDFLDRISILKEAAIAVQTREVSAMHDITEGGLATALKELSLAGHHQIRIDMDSIPIYPQTEKISKLFGIDPLGLIGSGSLLICCSKNATQTLLKEIQSAGIQATRIGEVIEAGSGIIAEKDGKRCPFPSFEADEITKLF